MKRRIFVFEFITGGGLAGLPLPASLLREGLLMRDALLRDACGMHDADVLLLHDARLTPPSGASFAVLPVDDAGRFEGGLDAALAQADDAFIVAPETGGVLAALAARVAAAGRRLLGCDAESCRIAGSKSLTADCLSRAGIAVLPHCTDAERLPDIAGRWVVKPDDGAGCDGLLLCADRHGAALALRAAGPGHVAQPWRAGEARSMNIMCARGEALLLSVNRQYLRFDGGTVSLAALGVGDVPVDALHIALAQDIAAALPGLLGHVGVDLVHTADGPVVVEINPRLSTSACALRDTLGYNLLAATLAAADGGPLQVPATPGRPQRIELDEAAHAV